MPQIPFITEEQILKLLNWESTFKAVECSMKEVARNNVVQPARSIIGVGNTKFYTMPGFLRDENFGGVACKLVSQNEDNKKRSPPLPSVNGLIVYFCPDSGIVKALMEAKEITKWRTAAASAVATKHIYIKNKKPCVKLAILGAGEQGVIHSRCFQNLFNFKKVSIWNRHQEKAERAVQNLNEEFDGEVFEVSKTVKECLDDADVIVTTTHAESPLIQMKDLKNGVHINTVGTGGNHCNELDPTVYQNSDIFVDYHEGANTELNALKELGVKFRGTVGDAICNGPQKLQKKYTVFQSLGMSVEDCAMARLIYDLYTNKN